MKKTAIQQESKQARSFEEKLKELDKNIRQEDENIKMQLRCGKCGSTNLTATRILWKISAGVLGSYYCRSCEFDGPAIEENRKKATKRK